MRQTQTAYKIVFKIQIKEVPGDGGGTKKLVSSDLVCLELKL